MPPLAIRFMLAFGAYISFGKEPGLGGEAKSPCFHLDILPSRDKIDPLADRQTFKPLR